MKKKNDLTQGAMTLTIISFVVKVLSAIYRIPLQNSVGDKGFYIYQQIYPIYGVAQIMALTSLPVFLASVIVEQEDDEQKISVIKSAYLLFSILGVFGFLSLYVGADFIAQGMGDELLQPIIRSVSWFFLLIPSLVILRGVSQANFDLRPTAWSQLMEQLARVSIILIVATSITGDLYHIIGVLMNSSWLAALVALGVLLVFYLDRVDLRNIVNLRRVKPKWQNKTTRQSSSSPNEREHNKWHTIGSLVKRFYHEGSVYLLLAAFLVLLQLVDAFTVYKGLLDNGMSATSAKVVKGYYDRGQPIVQAGVVFATSITTAYMPLLRKWFVERDTDRFNEISLSLLKVCGIFSTFITVGIIIVMPALNQFLFKDRSGTTELRWFALLMLPYGILIACQAIQQGKKQFRPAMLALSVGLLLKLATNRVLTARYGILGSSIGTTLVVSVVAISVLIPVLKTLAKPLKLRNLLWFGVIIVAMSLGSLAIPYVFNVLGIGESRLIAASVLLLQAIIGASIGLILLAKTRWLSQFEWELIPFGSKIYQLFQSENSTER